MFNIIFINNQQLFFVILKPWKIIVLIVVIVAITLVLVSLFTFISQSSECDEKISQFNIEGDEIDNEAEVLNKETDNFNREVAAYNREWLHSPASTQQMEQMRAELNENVIRHEEKLKNYESKLELLKDECDIELVPEK